MCHNDFIQMIPRAGKRRHALRLVFLCLAVCLSAFFFSSCADSAGQTAKGEQIPLPEVEFETKQVSLNGFSFAIPADWQEVENTTGTPATIYAPADAAPESGTSSVNIIIEANADLVYPSADEAKDAIFAQVKEQMTNLFPEACNYEFAAAEVRAGEVLSAKMDSDAEGTLVIRQYYPLIDGYVIVITGTDIGDGVNPAIDDVASYMLATLVKEN